MDSNLVQVNWETQKKILFSNLSTLRQKEVLTDITLSCDGENYAAHRLVLSMGSGYFAKNLEKCKNSTSSLVLICGVRADILKALLNFIYDGTTTIERKDIYELSQAGILLEVPGLLELGKQYPLVDKTPTEPVRPNNSQMSTLHSSISNHIKNTRRYSSSESTISSDSITIEDDYNSLEMEGIRADTEKSPSEDEQSCKVVTSTTLSFEDLFSSDDSSLSNTFEGWVNDGTEVFKRECVKGKRNFKCHLCRRSFFKAESLKKHIESHPVQTLSQKSSPEYSKCHNGKEIFYVCSICKRGFKSEKNCKDHVGLHINEKENVDKNIPKTQSVDEVSPTTDKTLDKKIEEKVSQHPINGTTRGEAGRTATKKKLNLKTVPKFKRRKKYEETFKESTMDDVLKTVSQSFKTPINNSGYLIHDDSIYDVGLSGDEIESRSTSNSFANNLEELDSVPKCTTESSNLEQSHSPVETTRVCQFCNTEFLNSRSFRKHRLTDCSILKCPFCLARFDSRKEYGEHITVHNNIEKK